MPSKYGGVPVEEQQSGGSKYGGIPVDDVSRETPLPGTERTGIPGPPKIALPLGLQPKKSDAFLNAPDNMGGGLESSVAGGIEHMANVPSQIKKKNYAGAGADLLEGAGGIASPLVIPALAAAPIPTALAAGGGYLGGKAGEGIARHFGASPDVQRLSGDLTALPAGEMGSMAGGLASNIARPLFRRGMGLTDKDFSHGADPVGFGLEQTSGVRPATIGKESQGIVTGLKADKDAVLKANSSTRIPMQPSRNMVADAISEKQAHQNDPFSAAEPIGRHLLEPTSGFAGKLRQPPTPMVQFPSPVLGANGQLLMTQQPGVKPPAQIAPFQNPYDFTGLMRGLKQFTNFNPMAEPPPEVGLANQTRGLMRNQLHQAVPSIAPIDKDIHDAIPLVRRGELAQLKPGPGENMIDRMTAQTGSLSAPLAAMAHGGPGAGALVLAGQALSADPSTRLIGARLLYRGGQPLPTGAGALVGSRKKQEP